MNDSISRNDVLNVLDKLIILAPIAEGELELSEVLLWAKNTIARLPSVEPSNDFLEFLFQVINPNRMEMYLEMYHCIEEATNGRCN